MIVLVQAKALTVGLEGKNQVLRELPIRLITMRSGAQAVGALRTEKVDGIISKWDLEDMPDGKFLKKFKTAKPDIPTIVFVRAGDTKQEVAARSLGVSAILTEEASDELFRQTVANVLGLKGTIAIKAISPAKSSRKTTYPEAVKQAP